MNLNNLNIIDIDYCLESGFFWVEFEGGENLQCCLIDDGKGGYLPAISANDNGFDWGICRDVNAWAATPEHDWDKIEEFILKAAQKNGIEVK